MITITLLVHSFFFYIKEPFYKNLKFSFGKILDNKTVFVGKPNNYCTIKMHQLLHQASFATISTICILPKSTRLTMNLHSRKPEKRITKDVYSANAYGRVY